MQMILINPCSVLNMLKKTPCQLPCQGFCVVRLSLQCVGVGQLQPVTSLCHHVRYVLMEFKDLDVFFLQTVPQWGFFEQLLWRCYFSLNVLLLHCTLVWWWGKRSGAEEGCELQERGQSKSSVQVLRGLSIKLPSCNLFGFHNQRIRQKVCVCVELMCYLSLNLCNLDEKVMWGKVKLF